MPHARPAVPSQTLKSRACVDVTYLVSQSSISFLGRSYIHERFALSFTSISTSASLHLDDHQMHLHYERRKSLTCGYLTVPTFKDANAHTSTFLAHAWHLACESSYLRTCATRECVVNNGA